MSVTWTLVCPSGELLPGEMRSVYDAVTGTPILVFNLDGELYALEDRCSHEDFELSSGTFDPATGSKTRLDEHALRVEIVYRHGTSRKRRKRSRPPAVCDQSTGRRKHCRAGLERLRSAANRPRGADRPCDHGAR